MQNNGCVPIPYQSESQKMLGRLLLLMLPAFFLVLIPLVGTLTASIAMRDERPFMWYREMANQYPVAYNLVMIVTLVPVFHGFFYLFRAWFREEVEETPAWNAIRKLVPAYVFATAANRVVWHLLLAMTAAVVAYVTGSFHVIAGLTLSCACFGMYMTVQQERLYVRGVRLFIVYAFVSACLDLVF